MASRADLLGLALIPNITPTSVALLMTRRVCARGGALHRILHRMHADQSSVHLD